MYESKRESSRKKKVLKRKFSKNEQFLEIISDTNI